MDVANIFQQHNLRITADRKDGLLSSSVDGSEVDISIFSHVNCCSNDLAVLKSETSVTALKFNIMMNSDECMARSYQCSDASMVRS